MTTDSQIHVHLPRLHPGQMRAVRQCKRFNVLMCGRRSGKTTLGEVIACRCAIKGHPVGWFAPTFKYMLDAWREITKALGDAIIRTDVQERRIELVGGGCIDFWSMDTTNPARGRKYALAILDECGIVKDLLECWQASIRPTLVDLRGDAWFLGTPKGRREFFQLFSKGESGEPDWASFRLESKDNPIIDPAEIEAARRDLPPQVFDQEMRGIPADDGGNPFGLAAIAECFAESKSVPANLDVHAAVYGIDLAKSQDWAVVIGLDDQGREAHFDRWQGIPWSDTTDRIVSAVQSAPCLVDSTGVGDPVLEGIQGRIPQAEGYHFSAPSKQKLMEGLSVAIQSRAIRLRNPILRAELENFGYEYTRTGVKYTAPSGLHDDCVCALAMAVHARSQFQPLSVSFAAPTVPTVQPADIGRAASVDFEEARRDPEWGWRDDSSRSRW